MFAVVESGRWGDGTAGGDMEQASIMDTN